MIFIQKISDTIAKAKRNIDILDNINIKSRSRFDGLLSAFKYNIYFL